MRKEFTIKVKIDTEDAAESSHTGRLANEPPNTFGIVVKPKGDEVSTGVKMDTLTILAHELGHVIALVGGSLAQKAIDISPEIDVIAEREAWEIGALMWPQLDRATAEAAFETYLDRVPRQYRAAQRRLF